MPDFKWKGINSYGEKRKGKLEAHDEVSARGMLKRMRIDVTVCKEVPPDMLANIAFFQPKVTGKDIVVFTRQLSTMIDAGLPLVQCLQILGKQQDNVTFKKILTAIQSDVETGNTLADAMRKHPKAFDTLYANMIEAGEVGGILDTILSRLAAFMEKSMILQKKVKGAMTYPVICLGISLLILVVILVFVIPVFEDMFKDFGAALPMPTQIVVWMSDAFKSNFIWMFLIGFAVVFLFKKFYATKFGELKIDALMLKAPVFGTLIRRVAVAKFCRTMSTMLQSGVPILDALDVVGRTAGNKVIEIAVFRTKDAIAEGRSIAEPLEETGVFPNMVVQMINVGEQVGALDTMMEKLHKQEHIAYPEALQWISEGRIQFDGRRITLKREA